MFPIVINYKNKFQTNNDKKWNEKNNSWYYQFYILFMNKCQHISWSINTKLPDSILTVLFVDYRKMSCNGFWTNLNCNAPKFI